MRAFAMPILIALLSFAGLIVALAGDGWHDAFAWGALGAPVIVAVRALLAARG